jgi:aspartate/methionine/tyrosine aminotransferase
VRRFPTYAAEERLRSLGFQRVPLHGTPAPALPGHVVEAVATALGKPMSTPPARGLAGLREALAVELRAALHRPVDPDSEILVTHGAMQALGVVFRAILEPGDQVLVPAPCFFFEAPIRYGGGTPVYVHREDGENGWDGDAIERSIGPRARAILLCNPGNPTGHVPSEQEVASVVALASRNGLLVVTDEAYEASVWEGARFNSVGAATDRALVVRSLGKSLSMPHLRLGLVAGPADLVERCAVAFEWDCIRVGVASQTAALAALAGPRDWLQEVRAGMNRGRAAALEVVEGIEEIRLNTPAGGPFLFLGATDGRTTLADELLAVGLPVVDGAEFQAPGRARLPFGGADTHRRALEQALTDWVENAA